MNELKTIPDMCWKSTVYSYLENKFCYKPILDTTVWDVGYVVIVGTARWVLHVVPTDPVTAQQISK